MDSASGEIRRLMLEDDLPPAFADQDLAGFDLEIDDVRGSIGDILEEDISPAPPVELSKQDLFKQKILRNRKA